MANKQHLDILKDGLGAWGQWRVENPQVVPDLSGAELFGVNLTYANFDGVIIRNALLNFADLSDATFRRADLRNSDLLNARLLSTDLAHASLDQTVLDGANFDSANLTHVSFRGAHLIRTNFVGANLSHADFTGSVVGGVIFADNDLSTVSGLDDLIYAGPATVGIDTMYRSKGKIPALFLGRVGVPDTLITLMSGLTGNAFEFYSCFISHSAKDKRFCDRLYSDLQSNSVRTWYFPEDATWGEPVWREIDRGIRLYDKLVVVCSRDSLQSGPVLREIERALNREDRETKNILFPIRLDDYIFDGWKHERKDDVLKKVVGDFQGWGGSVKKYENAFARLLKSLQSPEDR